MHSVTIPEMISSSRALYIIFYISKCLCVCVCVYVCACVREKEREREGEGVNREY